jgi:SAM-dependent methyltransferase
VPDRGGTVNDRWTEHRSSHEDSTMNLAERILLLLSRAPSERDYEADAAATTLDTALQLLDRVYPQLGDLVAGRNIADFGCGFGYQSIALAKKYGCRVVGIDTNPRTLQRAKENAAAHAVSPGQVTFVERIGPNMLGMFDVVISQNSFEHFGEPEQALGEMRSLLRDSGKILVTFGPPWFAPYGSHMQFFCKVPWINLLFSERTVLNVRRRYRADGARRYGEVESGLNKMTVRRFESLVSSLPGLTVTYRKYDCVKGMNWLSRLPHLRELFINHVTVLLSRS